MQAVTDRRPGLNRHRLLRLMREAVERCALDLDGMTVLTEAATGSYVVTPVLAALAGARKVYGLTRATRYGSVPEVAEETLALAGLAGVRDCIEICTEKIPEVIAQAHIVTNSGHLRPLDRHLISCMRSDAVIPLMYEAWEYRFSDLDVAACRERGILVGGTNERHPAIDVFSFLGIMGVKLLLDAGISVYRSRVLLVCDNAFRRYIELGLRQAGACVTVSDSTSGPFEEKPYDVIVIAVQPRLGVCVSAAELQQLAVHSPGAVVAQYWGDIDRREIETTGLTIWPEIPPPPGHMGVLPAAVGPEPTIRLQSGGLKAGEVMYKRAFASDPAAAQFVELM